jgi:hypothetical protein
MGERKFARLEQDRRLILRKMESAAENRMRERQAKEKCTHELQSKL